MTPKDKGMLRELLHEYGPSKVIEALAKEAYAGYGPKVGEFLRRLAEELDPTCAVTLIASLAQVTHSCGAPSGDPDDPNRCRA